MLCSSSRLILTCNMTKKAISCTFQSTRNFANNLSFLLPSRGKSRLFRLNSSLYHTSYLKAKQRTTKFPIFWSEKIEPFFIYEDTLATL